MGVSIRIGKEDITPGWRSMMHGLLLDNFQCINTRMGTTVFYFTKDDIRALDVIAMNQYRGEKEPPFDYSKDIYDSFQKIIKKLMKRKSDEPVIVTCEC